MTWFDSACYCKAASCSELAADVCLLGQAAMCALFAAVFACHGLGVPATAKLPILVSWLQLYACWDRLLCALCLLLCLHDMVCCCVCMTWLDSGLHRLPLAADVCLLG